MDTINENTFFLNSSIEDLESDEHNPNIDFLKILSLRVYTMAYELTSIYHSMDEMTKLFWCVTQANQLKRICTFIISMVHFIKEPSDLEVRMVKYILKFNFKICLDVLIQIIQLLNNTNNANIHEFTINQYIKASRLYHEMHDDMKYGYERLLKLV
jgi:hypothetical protein